MRRTVPLFLALLAILPFGGTFGCSPGGSPSLPKRETGHPILLIHAQKSGNEEAKNDRVWAETLESTFGGCDLWGSARFAASVKHDSLSNRLLVVFTHAALSELDTLTIERVNEYVKRGGIAFLDTPPEPWATAAGLRAVFTREREELPWPQALSWHTGAPNSSNWNTAESSEGALPGSLPPAPLRFTQLGFRPASYGLRSVGSPFGMSSIWWTSRGKGGWISEALCLPCLLQALARDSSLSEIRRAQWRAAIVHALLAPDIFPLPIPHVGDSPFSPPPTADRLEEWRALRMGVHLAPTWQAPRTLHLRVSVPSQNFTAAVAVPLRWRGRSLSDWTSSWSKTQSKSAQHGGQDWRLFSVPAGESTLDLRYSPTRWR